jgi:DNA/RNA-binding domain of Phe-tRNA-synthetase-like protein
MLEDITVDAAVHELRPDFAVLVMVAEGLVNGESDDRSTGWLEAAGRSAASVDDPHVKAWREAYRAFGAKPARSVYSERLRKIQQLGIAVAVAGIALVTVG